MRREEELVITHEFSLCYTMYDTYVLRQECVLVRLKKRLVVLYCNVFVFVLDWSEYLGKGKGKGKRKTGVSTRVYL